MVEEHQVIPGCLTPSLRFVSSNTFLRSSLSLRKGWFNHNLLSRCTHLLDTITLELSNPLFANHSVFFYQRWSEMVLQPLKLQKTLFFVGKVFFWGCRSASPGRGGFVPGRVKPHLWRKQIDSMFNESALKTRLIWWGSSLRCRAKCLLLTTFVSFDILSALRCARWCDLEN